MGDTWTEITADWKGDELFIGKNLAGGAVQMGSLDGKPGVGPMQLLLVGLAGCTGMDIVSILMKKRADLVNFQVRVRASRADDYPMIWKEIEVVYLLWGNNIPTKDIEQAIKLSEHKYCSVGAMLEKAARITSRYELMQPGETAG